MTKRPLFWGFLSVVILVACGETDDPPPNNSRGGAGGHAGHGAGTGGKRPTPDGSAGDADAGEVSAGTSGGGDGNAGAAGGGASGAADGGEPNAGSAGGGAPGDAGAGAGGSDAAGAGGADPGPGPRCTQSLYTPGDYSRTSATSTVVLGASVENRQDIFAGASSDGGAILTQLGCVVSERATILYDGSLETGVYTSVDVTNSLGFTWDEGTFSLAPDGVTVIGRVGSASAFGIQRRASRDVTTFGSVSTTEVANVNTWAAAHSAALGSPVLSPDGLSLFFNAYAGAESGIYEVTREDPSGVFSEPESPLAGLSDYAVTGISADRLTLFGYANWATDSFVRPTLDAAFTKQTSAPIAAFRMQPLDEDCERLIGTGTPGGCQSEEVYTVSAASE